MNITPPHPPPSPTSIPAFADPDPLLLVLEGITPMLQVLQELLFNPEDKTKVTLLFANKTPSDIMLKKEIDKLAAEHYNFEVIYLVSVESRGGSRN